MNNTRTTGTLLLAALLLHAPACFAERADRDKPIHVEADQVQIDDAHQVSTFEGHVQFTQGTLIIRGDKIVVVEDKEGFKHGTAYGHPASFRQKREGFDEYVEGYGERIEYDTRSEIADFYTQARVKRDGDDVRGDHITYNSKTEIFQVHSATSGSPSAPSKRVRAVIQPKGKEAAAPAAREPLPIKPDESLPKMGNPDE